jgi:hypothetical protein
MGAVASVCQPSTLRMLIWPEASNAQNSIATYHQCDRAAARGIQANQVVAEQLADESCRPALSQVSETEVAASEHQPAPASRSAYRRRLSASVITPAATTTITMTMASAAAEEARVSYQLFQSSSMRWSESAPSTEKIPLCRKDVPLRPKMQCYVSSRAF